MIIHIYKDDDKTTALCGRARQFDGRAAAFQCQNCLTKALQTGRADPGSKGIKQMKKHFDETITWPGLYGGGATVQVQIFDDVQRPDGGHVVIMSEPADNKGTSITNGVEHVAARIANDHALHPETTTFVERYPDREGPDGDESFDLLRFDYERERDGRVRFTLPGWTRRSFDDVKTWIGSDAANWTEL